jgi:hypothetical protein
MRQVNNKNEYGKYSITSADLVQMVQLHFFDPSQP